MAFLMKFNFFPEISFSESELEVEISCHALVGYFLNSMMHGPASERLKIGPSNAECVSICGDKPTPGGYSLTCHYFISDEMKSNRGILFKVYK